MNRIDTLFSSKKSNILSVYFTSGYPNLEDTTRIIQALDESGADLLEIGMPYSDSMVDGTTIQNSNGQALANGMSLKVLFAQLENIRSTTQMPLLMMGYVNQVIQYGAETFCQKCQEIGIDGVIIPDIPMFEYETEYRPLFEKYGLYNVFLVTPQTSDERIRAFDQAAQGFLYVVSSASTTGAKSDIQTNQEAYFQRLEKLNLKNHRLIGFGISDNKTFQKACQYANGAIIGSAFIKTLGKAGNLEGNIQAFIKSIRGQVE